MTGYYDYVLGLIPAALIGVTAFLNLVGLSLTAALPAGAAAAAGLIAHAMFVNSPVDGEGRAADGRAGGSPTRRPDGSTTGRSIEHSFERPDGPSDGGAVGRPFDRYSGRSRTGGASD